MPSRRDHPMNSKWSTHRSEARRKCRPRRSSADRVPDTPSFEANVARLFRHLRYRVRRRQPTHDQGVDLDIARHDLRAIVQCKHWRHPVGPAVIRDLYGTLLHTGADLGILATTSTISQSARSFAQGKPLLLLDGALLQLLLPDLS
jgi:restriction system protein